MEALRALVRGRVQGVGFRYFVLLTAERLGLCGFTRNLPDGRVEVVATGDGARLEQLVEALRQGPPGARVDTVENTPLAAVPNFTTFEVRG